MSVHNKPMTDLSRSQTAFIESVLRLKPRVAAFDCDGTLWSGDAGEGFFSWELDRNLFSAEIQRWARPRYAEYLAGRVAEEVMCGEMVTMHCGRREDVVMESAASYFEQKIVPNFFPEMQELVRRLRDAECDVWAVSSTNVWLIRVGMRHFGIPPDRILAAETTVESGMITDELVRVPSGEGKPEAIRAVLDEPLDCAFGNSIWDREMLEMSGQAFAINPNPKLKEIAVARRWKLYQP